MTSHPEVVKRVKSHRCRQKGTGSVFAANALIMPQSVIAKEAADSS